VARACLQKLQACWSKRDHNVPAGLGLALIRKFVKRRKRSKSAAAKVGGRTPKSARRTSGQRRPRSDASVLQSNSRRRLAGTGTCSPRKDCRNARGAPTPPSPGGQNGASRRLDSRGQEAGLERPVSCQLSSACRELFSRVERKSAREFCSEKGTPSTPRTEPLQTKSKHTALTDTRVKGTTTLTVEVSAPSKESCKLSAQCRELFSRSRAQKSPRALLGKGHALNSEQGTATNAQKASRLHLRTLAPKIT
jgi:hypothetical protein